MKRIIDTLEDFYKAQEEFFCVFKQISVENPEERAKQKNRLNKKYVFRGISSMEQLCPAIIRRFENNELSQNSGYSNLIEKYEIDMLYRFETNSSYNLDHVSSVFDFLATMRHYELPTRMIDWTRNPYTALLFAIFRDDKHRKMIVDIKKEKDLSSTTTDKPQIDCVEETEGFDFNNYYYVLRIDISKHVRFYDIPCLVDSAVKQNYIMHDLPYTTKYIYMFETIRKLFSDSNDNQRRKLIKFIFENTNSEYLFNVIHDNKKQVAKMNGYIEKTNKKLQHPEKTILFVEPRYSNRRMAAQYGLFQFPVELKKEEIKNTILHNSDILAINKELRLDVINELDAMGHNYYGLMPDLQGGCTYAKVDTDNWFKLKNEDLFRR